MKKKTSLLFLFRISKLFIGIISLSLSAKYYGVSFEKDSWLLAISVVTFLDLAIWGAINETFRSKFIFIRGEYGADEALNKTKSLLFFILFFSIFVVVFILLFPELLAKIIAPTYTGNNLSGLIQMIFFAAPILLINQLTAIGTSVLNANESYFIPEISGFVTAILNLLILILLAPIIGIYALVISYYVGAILLFGLIYLQIFKLKINIFSGYTNIKFSDFKMFILFALPFFFPYFLGQFSGVIEKTLVSSIGVGYVSILDYSRKFSDIIQGVLTSVLLTILVPILSTNYIEKKAKEFEYNFLQIYQLVLLFLTFVVALFTSSSASVVAFFLDKGTISKPALLEISNLMILYMWGTLAVFIYIIFGMALLSVGAVKKYAFWGIVAQILSIVLVLLFIKIVGVYIFPIALFISHLFSGCIMYSQFPYKSKTFYKVTFKYFGVLFITSLLLYFRSQLLFNLINPILSIIVNSLIIFFLLLSMIVIFKLEEKKYISNFIRLFSK